MPANQISFVSLRALFHDYRLVITSEAFSAEAVVGLISFCPRSYWVRLPMAEIALVRFVEARIAFLDANVSVGTDVGSQTFEKLGGDASKTILAKLTHMKGIAIDACTELIERVGKSVMLDSDKSSVIEAVRGKVDQEEVEVDARFFDARETQTQKHMFFEFYLVKSDWDSLANADASIELKIITLANRALAIGLVFPSEQTAASIVGIAMACSGRGGPDCLRWVREFKSVLRSLARVEKGSATALRPMEYAQDVNEFKAKYPDWYALSYKSEPPVDAPRIDSIVLQSVRGGVPCRSTRAGTMIGPSQRDQVKLQQQLMKALCPYAHREQQDHCANHETPGLKIFGTTKAAAHPPPLLANAARANPNEARKLDALAILDQRYRSDDSLAATLAADSPSPFAASSQFGSPTPAREKTLGGCQKYTDGGESKALAQVGHADVPSFVDKMVVRMQKQINGTQTTVETDVGMGQSLAIDVCSAVKKKKSNAKAAALTASRAAAVMKRPAASKERSADIGQRNPLAFPGVRAQAPKRFKGSTLYVHADKKAYRVVLTPGVERSASFKSRSPQEAWAIVVDATREFYKST